MQVGRILGLSGKQELYITHVELQVQQGRARAIRCKYNIDCCFAGLSGRLAARKRGPADVIGDYYDVNRVELCFTYWWYGKYSTQFTLPPIFHLQFWILPRKHFTYALVTIDYRCEDRKKVGEMRGDICTIIDTSWLSPSENPDHHLPKNEPFSQKVHLRIPLLSRGLKLSNSKPGCRVSALHFFVK